MTQQSIGSGWIRNPEHPTDQWEITISGTIFAGNRVYGVISQYAGSDSYCWQAVRGDERLSGIVVGREASMAMAEDHLALTVQEFNARVIADLLDDLLKLEQKILRLAPDTHLLAGYHAGFEDGQKALKRRLAALLDDGTLSMTSGPAVRGTTLEDAL